MLDARQLKRFGIPESRVPAGTTLRFQEPVAVGGVPHVVPGRCDGARPAGGAHRRSARRAAAPAGLAAAVGRTAPLAGPGRGDLDGVRQRHGPQGRDPDGSEPRKGGTRAADRGLRHLDLAWSRRGAPAGVPLVDTGRSPPRHVRTRRRPARPGRGSASSEGRKCTSPTPPTPPRRPRRHWPRPRPRCCSCHCASMAASSACSRCATRTRSRGRLRCSAASAPSARSSRPRSSGSGPTRPSAPSSRPSPT